MNVINFQYKESCLIDQKDILSIAKNLTQEIVKIKNLKKDYNTDYAFASLSKDQNNLQIVQELVTKKLALSPTALLVIGIGGSNLGTIAIHEALNGKFYNNKNPRIKIYFADTTDSNYISDIYDLMEKELQAYSNIIINVVTKSGTTTETIANFEIFLELLKKFKPNNFNEYIVITTDKDSLLWNYAKEINCSVLEIPLKVGGRFSVLSSVGLFPLGMLSINNVQILQGANDILDVCLDENLNNNIAALSASILYAQYKNNIKINDIFLFGNELEGLGKWYRQLMGESIGKEFDRENKRVNIGITPMVSIGSTDLHSVGQLYLGGPNDKFTTFVNVLKNKSDLKIPKLNEFEKIVPNIQGIKFSKIMDAIINGVKLAYLKKQIPFCSVTLNKQSEYDLGQFLQFKMFEIVYLGYLFGINPFDQPNVELYKKETKEILSKGSK